MAHRSRLSDAVDAAIPRDEREQFIRDNAVEMVSRYRATIERMRDRIRKLEATGRGRKKEIHRLQGELAEAIRDRDDAQEDGDFRAS
jgi:predicted RNase H-like nuclease (RuvC/YqgF family)